MNVREKTLVGKGLSVPVAGSRRRISLWAMRASSMVAPSSARNSRGITTPIASLE